MGNQILRRIAFIQGYFLIKITIFINFIEFLKYLEDENSIIFVLDEVGFGTKALRKYAYSPIGIPAILKKTELSHNLTCTATMYFYYIFVYFNILLVLLMVLKCFNSFLREEQKKNSLPVILIIY